MRQALLYGVAPFLVAAAPVRKPAANPAPRPVAKAAPAVFYEFKGARLGMTLDEWKAVPMPLSEASYGSAGILDKDKEQPRIWCSNDRYPSGKPVSSFYPSKAEKALGVVICKYARLWNVTRTYESLRSAYVKIGDYITDDVDYKFMDGKLYEINITGSKNLLGDVLDGLTAKWGPPTRQVNDTTQNKAGATFPHMERYWRNPAATIYVDAPWSRIDNMKVIYRTSAAAARLSETEAALNPAAEKM